MKNKTMYQKKLQNDFDNVVANFRLEGLELPDDIKKAGMEVLKGNTSAENIIKNLKKRYKEELSKK